MKKLCRPFQEIRKHLQALENHTKHAYKYKMITSAIKTHPKKMASCRTAHLLEYWINTKQMTWTLRGCLYGRREGTFFNPGLHENVSNRDDWKSTIASEHPQSLCFQHSILPTNYFVSFALYSMSVQSRIVPCNHCNLTYTHPHHINCTVPSWPHKFTAILKDWKHPINSRYNYYSMRL